MSASDRSSRRKKSISSISEVSAHQKAAPSETKKKNVNETDSTSNKNSNNMNWVSKSESIGLRVSL